MFKFFEDMTLGEILAGYILIIGGGTLVGLCTLL